MEATFNPIEKENIEGLHFPETDVLTDAQQIKQRKQDLEKAMALGNLEHIKIEIFFEDDKEKLMVNTTVWAVTPESIVLKKGVVIPIHRIHKIV